MILFSQILHSEIRDEAGGLVGKLKDAFLIPGEPYPVITALLVEQKGRAVVLPFSFVETLAPYEIRLNTLKDKLIFQEKEEKQRFRAREILDRQIVDTKGIRVVRANDLQFSNINNQFALTGIDVSTVALLRRLGLGRLPGFKNLPGSYINWEELSLTNGKSQYIRLGKTSQELHKLHPSDLANIIEDLKIKQGGELLQALNKDKAARVFEEVNKKLRVEMLESLGPEKMKEVIDKMSVDEIVDLLKDLVSLEEVEKILLMLAPEKEAMVRRLLKYKNESAGGLLDTAFMALPAETTIEEAIQAVQGAYGKYHSLTHIYVIDREGKLVGVVSLRRLLISDKNFPLKKIMIKPLATVRTRDSLKKVSVLLARYNLTSIAVVDKHKKILGVVYFDDVIGALVGEY